MVITAHQVPSYIQFVSDAPIGSSSTGGYEIRFQGHLHARWTAWFEGMSVSSDPDGTTLIRGEGIDQAALHGLLRKLADLGLPLVSVTQLRPDQPDPCTTTAR